MDEFLSGIPVRRSRIHDKLGGNRQSGISPNNTTGKIFLFSTPHKGRVNGYTDGWGPDGFYYYSGEGRQGDQGIKKGNRSVLHHAEEGVTLHLFKSVESGVVQHVGEFAVHKSAPYYWTDALDMDGEMRSMIVFRLVPVHETLPREPPSAQPPSTKPKVTDVPVEQNKTEFAHSYRQTQGHTTRRREAELVVHYRRHLEGLGHEVTRKKILPAGEIVPLYTDLHDVTANVLIEAKGSTNRESVRTAIGQLFDYRRYIASDPTLSLLLPERPRPDLLDLCASVDTTVVWRSGQGFDRATA